MGSSPSSYAKSITDLTTIAETLDAQFQEIFHPYIVMHMFFNNNERCIRVVAAFSCEVFAQRYIYRTAVNAVLKSHGSKLTKSNNTNLAISKDIFRGKVNAAVEDYIIYHAKDISLDRTIYNIGANIKYTYLSWKYSNLTNLHTDIDNVSGKHIGNNWMEEYIVELDPILQKIEF